MIREILQSEVKNALRSLSPAVDVSKVEAVRSEHFSDYASNAALIAAKTLGRKPLEVAEDLKQEILKSPTQGSYIKEISVAKPGFLNITVADKFLLNEIENLSKHLNKGFDFLKHKKFNIEFISANPTGDLHIGHGRGAFYGDILSNILSYSGAQVTREFYVNDSRESVQIKELGKTALGIGEQYKTKRLDKILESTDFAGMNESDAGFLLAERIGEYNRNFIEEKLGIPFDIWYSEDKHIREGKRGQEMLAMLKRRGFTYEKDGAVWLKTAEYGDDEDRVIIRSDGTASYFLSDIAYHNEKASRGDDVLIDVWGADHHGHVKRMYAVKKMLAWPGELQIFITQLVSLKEGGERKKMSKRLGTVILLEDLVDEFGIDVVRWFYAEKAIGTHMEFDMELAREQSAKNPVYYVQYAHARINSIEENAKKLSPDESTTADIMGEKNARALALKIAQFPEIIEDAANDYQIQKLTTYAYELASSFSQFYRDVRIVGGVTYRKGALDLAILVKSTLARSLKLLGISAPESM
jgi:arginyl-tRNA synthetase